MERVTSPPPRAADTCLRIAVALFCLGAALPALRYEGPVFTYLFMYQGWSEAAAAGVEHAGAWLLLACLPLLLFRRAWPALLLISAWTAVRAAAQAYDEVWHPELIPAGQASRLLAPVALALLASRATAGRVRAAGGVLRLAVAATFAGHGLEALYGRPEFVDFIITAGRKLGGVSVPEAAAREMLGAIGVVDLAVAAALALPCRLAPVALWAAFWGLVTAGARIVHLGWWNAPEALVRGVNSAVPLALFFAWRWAERRPRTEELRPAGPPLRVRPAFARAALLALLLTAGLGTLLAQDPSSRKVQGTAPFHARVIWSASPESQATVSWSTARAGTAHRVHYDLQPRRGLPAAYAFKTDAQKNGRFSGGSPELYYHHAVLTGLQPSTTYYFILASDGALSREYHFVTAPAEDLPFRLLAGGDSRSDARARRTMNGLLAKALSEDRSILALCHGGDFIRTGTSLAEWAEWLGDHELTVTPSGRMLPVLPTRGNHERTGVQFDEVWNWPGGGLGKNYYATRIGPQALMVTLNTNISTAGDQAAFLEKTLRENAKLRWQLAQYHRPAYPAVKTPSSGKEAWVPIFEKYNVDLVCEADGHNIKRTVPIRNDKHDPTGVVYIGEGGLGVSQRTPDDDLWYLQPPGKCGKGHHYYVLSFDKDALKTKTVLMNGAVFDEYELKPRKR
jgi:hypothetical protein